MNFDIDSVPLGRPTQHRSRSRSRERSPESRYRRDQRSFRGNYQSEQTFCPNLGNLSAFILMIYTFKKCYRRLYVFSF